MIKLDWSRDKREINPKTYHVDPKAEKESRWRAFLAGWTRFLNGEGRGMDGEPVTWVATGMFCASVLGDQPREVRKMVYKVMLTQFLSTEQTADWDDDDRQKAISLADFED